MIMNPLTIAFLLILFALPVRASNHCSGPVISATADVSVSDGSSFSIESFFSAPDEAAIRFIDEHVRVIAVEGNWAWFSKDEAAQLGQEFHKVFALGHQFHALLLHFDEIAVSPRRASDILFGDAKLAGFSGEYPYGGNMHLITVDGGRDPDGLVLEFPESPRIEVYFGDWRALDDTVVPFHLRIDDGQSVFDYHYTEINISQGAVTWLQEQLSAPDIEEIVALRASARKAGC